VISCAPRDPATLIGRPGGPHVNKYNTHVDEEALEGEEFGGGDVFGNVPEELAVSAVPLDRVEGRTLQVVLADEGDGVAAEHDAVSGAHLQPRVLQRPPTCNKRQNPHQQNSMCGCLTCQKPSSFELSLPATLFFAFATARRATCNIIDIVIS